MADARDARITKLETELAASLEREKRFGELIAQQQTLIAAQQELLTDLRKQLAAVDAERAASVGRLEREVSRLERELLGPKTERVAVPPIERELAAEMTAEERAKRRADAAAKRRERAIARNAALEVEEVTHVVPEGTECAKCHGTKLRHLDYETSTTFEYKPGRFVRRVHKRQKKSCACGECIVAAPLPPKVIARGQYGFGFVAYLIVAKCADSIPIARLEKRFARLGIPVARSTMNDLVHDGAELARPLVGRLTARIRALEVVLADETSMRIKDRAKRGFVWVFQGHDNNTGGQLVLYVFAVDRSGKTPEKILGGSDGVLVVDGYTGYNNVTDPDGRTRGGCWSHLRRKLFEARSMAPADAEHAIALIRGLFRVERDATEQKIVRTPAHLALRTATSKPLVDAFFKWAEATRPTALPKSPLGEALGYAINQRQRLELFLTDARIPIHNNSSESRLRVIALARHTFMFFGHPLAGRNFAGLYSLVGSAIANGIEPTEYLTDVLPRIRDATTDEELDALLPDRWTPRAPPEDDSADDSDDDDVADLEDDEPDVDSA